MDCDNELDFINDRDNDLLLESELLGIDVSRRRFTRKRRQNFSPCDKKTTNDNNKLIRRSNCLTDEAEDKIKTANNLYIEGKYDESLSYLQEVVRIAPGAHEPFHLIGLIHESAFHNYTKAINSYLIAAYLLKKDDALWSRIGQLALKINRFNLAIYAFKRVIPIRCTDSNIDEDICFQLSELLFRTRDFLRSAIYKLKLLLLNIHNDVVFFDFVKVNRSLQSQLFYKFSLSLVLYYTIPEIYRSLFNLKRFFLDYIGETPLNEEVYYKIIETNICLLKEPAIIDSNPDIMILATALNCNFSLDEAHEYLNIFLACFYTILNSNSDSKQLTIAQLLQYLEHLPLQILTAFLYIFVSTLLNDKLSECSNKDVSPDKHRNSQTRNYFTNFINHDSTSVQQILTVLISHLIIKINYIKRLNDHVQNSALVMIAGCLVGLTETTIALKLIKAIESMTAFKPYKTRLCLLTAKCQLQTNNTTDAIKCLIEISNYNTTKCTDDLASNIDRTEASLLLWNILSKTSSDQTFNNVQLSQNDLFVDHEILARRAINNNRLKALQNTTPITKLPDEALSPELRRNIFALINQLNLFLKNKLINVDCLGYFDSQSNIDELTSLKILKIPESSLRFILPEDFHDMIAFFMYDDLTLLKLLMFSKSSVDTSLKCGVCNNQNCNEVLSLFIFRLVKINSALYIILIQDCYLDSRRISEKLYETKTTAIANLLTNSVSFINRNSSQLRSIGNEDGYESIKDDMQSELRIEDSELICNLKPTSFLVETQLQNNRHNSIQLSSSHHKSISIALNLLPIEEFIDYDLFVDFLSVNTDNLCSLKLNHHAIITLNLLFAYFKYKRLNFQESEEKVFSALVNEIDSLCLYTALRSGLIEHSLKSIRKFYLFNDYIQKNSKLKERYYTIYINLLFDFIKKIDSTEALSSSNKKSIMLFNKAFIIKQLYRQTSSLSLLCCAAHFSILSQRFSAAASLFSMALISSSENSSIKLAYSISLLHKYTRTKKQKNIIDLTSALYSLYDHANLEDRMIKDYCVKSIQYLQKAINNSLVYFLSSNLADNFIKLLFFAIPTLSTQNLIEQLSYLAFEFVRKGVLLVDVYARSQRKYNLARFCQHLSKSSIATKFYTDIIQCINSCKNEISLYDSFLIDLFESYCGEVDSQQQHSTLLNNLKNEKGCILLQSFSLIRKMQNMGIEFFIMICVWREEIINLLNNKMINFNDLAFSLSSLKENRKTYPVILKNVDSRTIRRRIYNYMPPIYSIIVYKMKTLLNCSIHNLTFSDQLYTNHNFCDKFTICW